MVSFNLPSHEPPDYDKRQVNAHIPEVGLEKSTALPFHENANWILNGVCAFSDFAYFPEVYIVDFFETAKLISQRP